MINLHLVTVVIVLPYVTAGCLPNGQMSKPPAPAPSSGPWVPPPPAGPACKDCPNIIFALTDDQGPDLIGQIVA